MDLKQAGLHSDRVLCSLNTTEDHKRPPELGTQLSGLDTPLSGLDTQLGGPNAVAEHAPPPTPLTRTKETKSPLRTACTHSTGNTENEYSDHNKTRRPQSVLPITEHYVKVGRQGHLRMMHPPYVQASPPKTRNITMMRVKLSFGSGLGDKAAWTLDSEIRAHVSSGIKSGVGRALKSGVACPVFEAFI